MLSRLLAFQQDACGRLLLSNGLALGIALATLIIKVPQIMRIAKSGSAKGISLGSQIMEFAVCAVATASAIRSTITGLSHPSAQLPNRKSFTSDSTGVQPSAHVIPLTEWLRLAESAGLLVQNFTLCLLTIALQFWDKPYLLPVFCMVCWIGQSVLCMHWLVSDALLSKLQEYSIPLILAARIPVILEALVKKSTGKQSAFSCAFMLLGAMARLSVLLSSSQPAKQDVTNGSVSSGLPSKKSMVAGHLGHALVNGILLVLCLVYGDRSNGDGMSSENDGEDRSDDKSDMSDEDDTCDNKREKSNGDDRSNDGDKKEVESSQPLSSETENEDKESSE